MNDQIVACLDGSSFSSAICDYAAWSAQRLAAPLTLLHVLDHRHAQRPPDLSGSIGLGSQDALLAELALLDQQKGKVAMERGRLLLEAAHTRLQVNGPGNLTKRLLHGQLVERLTELEPATRLLVIGRRGESAHLAPEHLGSNLERVIRAIHRPILVVPSVFTPPRSMMLAFDGSATTRKVVETLARSALFQGVPCHLVMVAEDRTETRANLAWAARMLETAGFATTQDLRTGDVETELTRYQHDHNIDVVVMGAYGHSRIRHLLVGSTTTAIIRALSVPVLLLR